MGINDMWQYTCPKCGAIGAGLPNRKYKCHRCNEGILARSSNGRIYPEHGNFDKDCNCTRCVDYWRNRK